MSLIIFITSYLMLYSAIWNRIIVIWMFLHSWYVLSTAPNLVWCGDFTYINIGKNRFVYLCVIIDLFSRKIIAYTVSAKHNAQMAIETFKKAYYSRNCPKSLMFH